MSHAVKLTSINNIKALGGFVCFLGALVIVGWHTNNKTLIQVLPVFAPMQYNTAFGFFFSGLGVLLLERYFSASRICGVIVAVLGFLTLLQYVFLIDLGVDQLLMDASIMTKVSHPGRMAPNTACCFILSGLALLFSRNSTVIFSLIASLFMLSGLAFVGYIIGAEGLYGFGALTRMAIHTAIGFVILSLSLFFWQKKLDKTDFDIWEVLPFVVAVCCLVMTFLVWHGVSESVSYQNKKHFESITTQNLNVIEKRFALYEQALRGATGFVKGSNKVSRREWRDYVDALNVGKHLPGTNGVGFIDLLQDDALPKYLKEARSDGFPNFVNHPKTKYKDKFIIKYIEPANINLPAVGLDIGFEKNRREAAEHARDTGKITLTRRITLVQDNQKLFGFLLLAPVYEKSNLTTVEERRKTFIGWAYSPFMARKFMSDIGGLTDNQVSFAVYDGKNVDQENLIYEDKSALPNERFDHLYLKKEIKVDERIWTIVWRPTASFVPKGDTKLPGVFLIAGFIVTIILSGLFYLISMLYGKSARDLEKQREELQLIFDTVPVRIWHKDDKNNILRLNKKAAESMGGSVEDFEGGSVYSLFPKMAAKYHQDDLDVIHAGKPLLGIVEKYTPAGQEAGWSLTDKVPYSLGADKGKGLLVVSQDITQQKLAEKRLEKLVDQLSHANTELERFAYLASHDLQEPMRMVSNFTRILKERLEGKLDDEQKEWIDIVVNSSSKMQGLITDLLSYSRIDHDTINVEAVDCEDLMKNVEDTLSHQINQSQAVIVYEDLPTIQANPVHLNQILQNLISNAIKYQPKERKDPPRIVVSIKKTKKKTVISVEDNGIGIKKEYKAQIFEPFKRLNSISDYKGTGVGLAIVKKIVDKYGGSISVESTPDVGSVFTVTFHQK